MSQQQTNTTKSGNAAVAGLKPGLTHELKPEWVQQTLKIERLASAELKGAEDQPVGRADVEERMHVMLPAGGSIEAAREALVDYINGLG